MKKQKIEVENTEENQVPAKVLASSIEEIGRAMKKLSSTRLSRDAVVALIKDKTGHTKLTINIILNNLEQLEEIWLKRK